MHSPTIELQLRTPTSVNCEGLLSALWTDIAAAHAAHRASGQGSTHVSNFLFPDASAVTSPFVHDGSVVSLGSGPDIFLPLHLYPTARHFHLVDSLHGWGRGPHHVIEEIETRLTSLQSDTSIERLDKLGDWRAIDFSITREHWQALKSPLIWRVRWTRPFVGSQEKLFYLHQVNYNLPRSLANFEPHINETSPLIGVLLTGASADLSTMQFFLNRLFPQGSMFAEMLYSDANGDTTPTGEDVTKLEEIGKNFEIIDLGDSRHKDSPFFRPRTLLIRPVHGGKVPGTLGK